MEILSRLINNAIKRAGAVSVTKKSETFFYTAEEAQDDQKYWMDDDPSKSLNFSKHPFWVNTRESFIGFDSLSELFYYLLDNGFDLEDLLD